MFPQLAYALITFLIGLSLLLGWPLVNIANPRRGILLKKSVLLFALPIAIAPYTNVEIYLGSYAWIACEESLKTIASRSEAEPFDKFWLVSLFGLWELTINKSLWGLIFVREISSLSTLDMISLIYGSALPVLMHTVTAAIYAFAVTNRLWAAFFISWLLHAAFNFTVVYLGAANSVVIIQTIVLTLILAGILLARNAHSRTSSD